MIMADCDCGSRGQNGFAKGGRHTLCRDRVFQPDCAPANVHIFVSSEKTKFFINRQVFDEGRTDVKVKLGDTEEWTVRNEDSQYHDFHIHQIGLLVTEVNGGARPFRWLTRHVQRSDHEVAQGYRQVCVYEESHVVSNSAARSSRASFRSYGNSAALLSGAGIIFN